MGKIAFKGFYLTLVREGLIKVILVKVILEKNVTEHQLRFYSVQPSVYKILKVISGNIRR